MRPALANAPDPEPEVDLLAAFAARLSVVGKARRNQLNSAKRFLRRWPSPQAWAAEPLTVRLAIDDTHRTFLMFLLMGSHLRPGYDFLVLRKLTSFWRELPGSPIAEDVRRFLAAAEELGFTERTRVATASQVLGRLLIQTGRPMQALTGSDLDELAEACRRRESDCRTGWRHYRKAIHTTRQVFFHVGVFAQPPANPGAQLRQSFAQRMRDATDALRPSFVAYLDRLIATHTRNTVTGTASRLNHFAAHLATVDPDLVSLAELDRRRHIETYLTAVATATSSRDGAPLSASERRCRVLAVHCLLNDITEWEWPEAPRRKLVFRGDIPRLPRALPRYLTPIWTAGWPPRWRRAAIGWPATRCCWPERPESASANWSTWNWIAFTRSPARAPG